MAKLVKKEIKAPKLLTKEQQKSLLIKMNVTNLIEPKMVCPVCKNGYCLLTRKRDYYEDFRCFCCKSDLRKDFNGKVTVERRPEILGVYDGPRKSQ